MSIEEFLEDHVIRDYNGNKLVPYKVATDCAAMFGNYKFALARSFYQTTEEVNRLLVTIEEMKKAVLEMERDRFIEARDKALKELASTEGGRDLIAYENIENLQP